MRWAAALAALALAAAPAGAQIARLQAELAEPPADARPMVRWWWFGPAVTDAGIRREIAAMKAGGFGGFEVQQLYPLTPDDPARGIVNLSYLSDLFIAALRSAGEVGRANGMRVDVTIGTGWPFGGPQVAVTDAAANVVMIEGKRVGTQVLVPRVGPGEELLAAFTKDGLQPVAIPAGADRIDIDAALLFFVATRTGQQVKRAALGGEGYVLDHLGATAPARYIEAVGGRLLDAFKGATPPYAMFSDSLEAYGSSWTDDLPAEFRKRRGYDLLAHLPALFLDLPDSPGVRYDWAKTLTELVEERYLSVADRWAKARGTRFRAQVYGIPPVQLSANAQVALPEGEGADWRRFTSTRWATSAAHLYGRPVVSSEVWTWLHSPAFRATPLDMKAEADQHFLQGVTQLIGHGWPYTPPGVEEPGWAMYAAGVFNDHNPWWGVMPDITRYLARVSHALRQGEPDNGVAIYLPSEDAMAAMRPERASIDEAMRERVPPELIAQVLDAGHNFDFVDGAALEAGRVHHRALILPRVDRIAPAAYRAIEAYAAKGGRVIAVGAPPSRAPGLVADDRPVAEISARLFARGGGGTVVRPDALGKVFDDMLLLGDMRLLRPDPAIGFIRRSLDDGDIYFVVNTSSREVRNAAKFASGFVEGRWLDPRTGEVSRTTGETTPIMLAPYESKLLLFGRVPAPSAPAGEVRTLADLSKGWSVEFLGAAPRTVDAGWSWTDDPATRFHSGTALYARTIELPRIEKGERLLLDFGTGRAVDRDPRARGFQAWFEPPVREAAVVTVNGKRAGTLWAPPYRIDVTAQLRPGLNRIHVEVANTAINLLAGRTPADYRLLGARYGERFQPQDMDNLKPLPSGLMEPIRLLARRR